MQQPSQTMQNNWHEMEVEANKDLKTGRYKEFNSIEKLIEDLNP